MSFLVGLSITLAVTLPLSWGLFQNVTFCDRLNLSFSYPLMGFDFPLNLPLTSSFSWASFFLVNLDETLPSSWASLFFGSLPLSADRFLPASVIGPVLRPP